MHFKQPLINMASQVSDIRHKTVLRAYKVLTECIIENALVGTVFLSQNNIKWFIFLINAILF